MRLLLEQAPRQRRQVFRRRAVAQTLARQGQGGLGVDATCPRQLTLQRAIALDRFHLPAKRFGLAAGLRQFLLQGAGAAVLGLAQGLDFGFQSLGPAFGLLGAAPVLDALLDERLRARAACLTGRQVASRSAGIGPWQTEATITRRPSRTT